MRDAILPLPQYDFMAWCLIKHRDNLNLSVPCSEKVAVKRNLSLYLVKKSHEDVSIA